MLNSTIRYTIHDTIQNITIHDTKYDSTSMRTTRKKNKQKEKESHHKDPKPLHNDFIIVMF
jgi:hypothetical protein